MPARAALLLATLPLLGCGINNNCGEFNPFGCAKDLPLESSAETTEPTTNDPSVSSSTTTSTSGDESSSDTTSPVEPTIAPSTETSTSDATTTTTEPETTETTDGTTMPPPVCGDGVKEGIEQCDDGNEEPGDGCSEDCRVERIVFATKTLYTGALGGLEGADDICQDAGVDLGGSYKAWLSIDDGTAPATRFASSSFTGVYVLPDGEVVAEGWSGLMNDPLLRPIDQDESGEPVEGSVWTNTNIEGKPVSLLDHCALWTSGSSLAKSTLGLIGMNQSDQGWTDSLEGETCDGTAHLYCFEVP